MSGQRVISADHDGDLGAGDQLAVARCHRHGEVSATKWPFGA
jgi:hypothetical protein